MQNKSNWDDQLRPAAAKTCSRGDAEARRKARLNPSGPLRPGVSARGIKCAVENKPNLARPGQRRVCDGERCETKPIPGGVGNPSPAPRPSAKGGCTNKANSRRSKKKGKCFAGNELWWIGHAWAFGETKPIPGEARWDEARGTRDEAQMRQTNPIWSGRGGRDAGGRQTPPGHDGAKQSQFPPALREGQVVCRKEVMVNGTCNRRRQNKANLPARPRTGMGQGSQQRSRRSGVLRQTNPICGSRDTPLFQGSSPMAIMQNKPNLPRAPRNGRRRPGLGGPTGD